MLGFHLCSQFIHISPSDEITNLREAEVKTGFNNHLEIAGGYHVFDHRFEI